MQGQIGLIQRFHNITKKVDVLKSIRNALRGKIYCATFRPIACIFFLSFFYFSSTLTLFAAETDIGKESGESAQLEESMQSFFIPYNANNDGVVAVKLKKYQMVYNTLYCMHNGIRNPSRYFLDDSGEPSAYYNRKMALFFGKSSIPYLFFNYSPDTGERKAFPYSLVSTSFDGVSNVLYNISYLASIPAKLLHGSFSLFPSETTAKIVGIDDETFGISEWFDMLLSVLAGFFIALIMMPLGFMIGLLFHPFQTFANLVFLSMNTNIFTSVWDLVVGAIILPLWDVVSLFGTYWDIIKSIFV